MNPSAFLPEISQRYDFLTPTEKKLADYILQYPSETLSLSASALAQRAGTAPSAVIRLCKSLGYEGFSAFKLQLAVILSRQTPASYMPGVAREDSCGTILDKIFSANIKALQDTLARIDRNAFAEIVELICGARCIHIYGVGTSAGMVGDLQHRLMLLGLHSQAFTDIAAMRLSTMNLRPGDVAFGISHSGKTTATVDALELSQKAGAKTVCLTSYQASPITKVSDHVLTVYSDDTHYPIEAVSARIAQAGVIDALVAALSVRHYKQAENRSNQIHELMGAIRSKGRK